ncbi:methionine ABC transporter ATP-binding protein [Aeromicrobium sp. YIM 150415]|uniref:methionine ABC transporter ATP-binding protein n=1 Tax=Aeromicrobium sp. YIM 150415 TaxID=2803912 RepID=UPI001963365F|nr:methionine ABC transporter ATP-binding protein [Aeromicrobium sp. YIM 150415]MBM9462314.1 methionine ABC transporter ATP-binding protein [Aeromicrobium sp. YIM 150415]
MALIELRDVAKAYPPRRRGGDPVHAVDGVTLDVAEGEILGIVGYSGAGKSTLARLINALEPATSGSVVVAGQDLTTLRESELQKVRRTIGMIFQQFNLFHSRTVWGNIAYPLKVAGISATEQQERISELLHFVGLADKAHQYPEQLSGGQKQRVGVARALASSPRILLADEATSALDPETTQGVVDLLRRVNAEFGITIVVITHEMEVVKNLADRVAVMEDGKVVESGTTFDLFARPAHEVTRRFVNTVVDDMPPASVVEELRKRHPGRLVTLGFREDSASQSQVFGAFGEAGVGFELIYGGMEEVQGKTFGNLTVELTGGRVDEAVRVVSGLVEVREVR